ncbi:hypothetical protein LARI1_G002029 [Lachnellula arida]|uniref:Uncharacterized protein n=1 Tax=Lachnellula arida TaxID=1316785 RepID=A0A8T9BI10_9HELO|nr:hypothetical protein LARI1_G002029 [Lachnellula arida]
MPDASINDEDEVFQETSSPCQYRPGIPITEDIQKHCHIYLDEQLYGSALTLLGDLVTSGASHPEAQDKPAFVPIPYHIELVSALLIHPRYTSQLPPDERVELASKAITFLRNTLLILGPVNANLVEAFSLSPFTSTRTSRRSRVALERDEGTSGSDTEDKLENVKGVIGNKGRMRNRAQDFWHIVGWAFNCSVKYPKRWQYWKVYLDYMLDVLDADWKERERLDRESMDGVDGECDFTMVRKGLLMKYLSEVGGKSSAMRRVVRSVFADAGPDSLKEFPEVFEDELKDRNMLKRKRADTMDHKFGDYEEEAEISDDDSSPMRADDEGEGEDEDEDEMHIPLVDPYLGGTESIALRQRVLTLLSRASYYFQDEIMPLSKLYEMVFMSLKHTPIPAFSLLMSPSTNSFLHPQLFVSLALLGLKLLLPNNAPTLHSILSSDSDDLTQEVLEKCLLPFPASTSSTDENARVSILVENCLRVFLRSCECWYTPGLGEAIERGIKARDERCKGEKKPKDVGARKRQETAREWLTASGGRLKSLLSFVEVRTANDWN